jgi:hypothetical protein
LNSCWCIVAATPPPYSSIWISISAAFGRPPKRGMAQVCGSASPQVIDRAVQDKLAELLDGRSAAQISGQ